MLCVSKFEYHNLWVCPSENLPYGILLSVMLVACTVMTFAWMTIIQQFDNGKELLSCSICSDWCIILLMKFFNCPIQNSAPI